MRKTLLDMGALSVVSVGRRVSASTQTGAFCVFEFWGAFWRRSSQALSGVCCCVASVGAGRASVNASCAYTRQIAANNIAKTARTNIERARLFDHRLDCKLSVSMRPDLQAVCHLEYGRQNAEHNQ